MPPFFLSFIWKLRVPPKLWSRSLQTVFAERWGRGWQVPLCQASPSAVGQEAAALYRWHGYSAFSGHHTAFLCCYSPGFLSLRYDNKELICTAQVGLDRSQRRLAFHRHIMWTWLHGRVFAQSHRIVRIHSWRYPREHISPLPQIKEEGSLPWLHL